jgi:hypothetical protein
VPIPSLVKNQGQISQIYSFYNIYNSYLKAHLIYRVSFFYGCPVRLAPTVLKVSKKLLSKQYFQIPIIHTQVREQNCLNNETGKSAECKNLGPGKTGIQREEQAERPSNTAIVIALKCL